MLDKSELPVLLPYDVNLEGKGNALLKLDKWRKVICSKANKTAYRETDTLDTFVDSSWYYIRFLNNELEKPFDSEQVNKFLPVDKYIGGIEHAILHLLYSRFFMKALERYMTWMLMNHSNNYSHKGWLHIRHIKQKKMNGSCQER